MNADLNYSHQISSAASWKIALNLSSVEGDGERTENADNETNHHQDS